MSDQGTSRQQPRYGKGNNKKKSQFKKEQPSEELAGTGVSKTKAALRQTRRLLAKDNLSASIRQEAERKLSALEDELRTKETQQKERNNAQRYHKVRFFERQKLVRKIKKLKKARDEGNMSLDDELFEARSLLNYVLHFPMTQKYVALFPNQQASNNEYDETDVSKKAAAKVKEKIVESMKKGALSNEPEVELEQRASEEQQQIPREKKRLLEEEGGGNIGKKSRGAKGKEQEAAKNNLEDDDFFAAGEE